MSKAMIKTALIALVAIAAANRIPQLKELINGDSGWF